MWGGVNAISEYDLAGDLNTTRGLQVKLFVLKIDALLTNPLQKKYQQFWAFLGIQNNLKQKCLILIWIIKTNCFIFVSAS